MRIWKKKKKKIHIVCIENYSKFWVTKITFDSHCIDNKAMFMPIKERNLKIVLPNKACFFKRTFFLLILIHCLVKEVFDTSLHPNTLHIFE